MASATVGVNSRMSQQEALDWLQSVEGLPTEAARQARTLFTKHGVDGSLLHFLVSAVGAQVLLEYSKACAALASSSQSAGDEAEPAPEQAPEAGSSKASSAPQLRGRQRITMNDRRKEKLNGHYFTPNKPEQALQPADSKQAKVANLQPGESKQGRAANLQPRSQMKSKSAGEERRVQSSKYAPQPRFPRDLDAAEGEEGCADTKTSPYLIGSSEYCLQTQGQPLQSAPVVTGTLKSFNQDTGYGFFHCQSFSQDVFLCRKSLPPGCRPQCGRVAKFEVIYDEQHRPQARNVMWQAADEVNPLPARYHGRLKSLGKDYAFVECKEAYEMYGRDVYIGKGQLPDDTCEVSQAITFELILSNKGQPQGKNIMFEEEAASEANECASDAVDSNGDDESRADECGQARATRW
mmetsp:Transcript_31026/g.56394  ORF Transcript_31026/g.56394 Transcript_31026/m.56394 type:complete len:408 (+) Transcript_31026:95-1318(+)